MKIYDEEHFKKMNTFEKGMENTMFAQYFTGASFINPLTMPGEDAVLMFNVTFEPGCINDWHIHHALEGGGQILLCIAGEGWYQQEGQKAQSLKPGDVVKIPAGVKHWHGAKKDSWFSHIAIEVPGKETQNQWLEPVDAHIYEQLR
ncbi:cupin domain-containing protein [Vallitaleaceae bacterium 9-2]